MTIEEVHNAKAEECTPQYYPYYQYDSTILLMFPVS